MAEGASDGVQAAASAARFGFGQARAAWEGNVPAQQGWARATALLAIWSAGQGDIATAEGLAAEIGAPDPEVQAALAAARQRLADEAARVAGLQRLGRDLDPLTGQRTRLFVVSILVVLWSVMPLIGIFRGNDRSYFSLYAVPLFSLYLAGGLTLWARESLLATRVNRQGLGTLGLMILAQLVVTTAAWTQGLTPSDAMAMVSVTWALASAMFAMTVERRLWPSSVVYWIAAGAHTLWPDGRLWALFLSNLFLLGNMLPIWNPRASVAPKDVPTS